jgi:predicted LPLAT superfamily acyltransferase
MAIAMKLQLSSAGGGHWANINEATFTAGMRLLFWICRVFGRWPFRVVLYPVVVWYVLVKPAARKASADYLRRIAAFDTECRIKPGARAVLRHFATFAESILDKMLLWGGLFNVADTRLYGQRLLTDRVAEGRGGLLICAHLGNLELCRVLARQQPGLKLTVLVHTRHAQAFNEMLAQLDPDSQLNLMQVTEMSPATAVLLAEKVEQGEFIVIAGDRIPVSPNPRVAIAPFLGALAPFPVGPYILASLLRCPAYLIFAIRTGRISELHFELLRESISLPRKGRDQMLAELAAEYSARLEHFCLRAPLQWFNFYDFWHLPTMDNSDASR